MKNNKKLPVIFLISIIATVSLLTLATINGARAAIKDESDEFSTDIAIKDLDLELESELFSGESEEFVIGKEYSDEIRVVNTGTMNEYVRLVIHKYWTNADEVTTEDNTDPVKRTDLDSEMINMSLSFDQNWKYYKEGDDCIIIYYSPILYSAAGETSESEEAVTNKTTPVSISFYVDEAIKSDFERDDNKDEETGITTTTFIYKYDGASFYVEIEADGVQTHNAVKAVVSAWGARDASIDGNKNIFIPQISD